MTPLSRPTRTAIAAVFVTVPVVAWFGVTLHPYDRFGFAVGVTVACALFLGALAVEER